MPSNVVRTTILSVLCAVCLSVLLANKYMQPHKPTRRPVPGVKQTNGTQLRYELTQPTQRPVPEVKQTSGTQLGYVLTLEYTGQLVAGLRGIVSLQCWVASFGLPMLLVEPYVVNSSLIHDTSVWRQVETETHNLTSGRLQPLALSDYFNVSMYNHVSQREGRPPLVRWETLWDRAPRNLIVVTIGNPFAKTCLKYTKSAMCGIKEVGHNKKRQFMTRCKQSQSVGNSVAYLESRGFKVVRSVCLNCGSKASMYLTPTEVVHHIFGDHNPQEVTLVISQWRFYYEMTHSCTSCKDHSGPLGKLSPGPQILKHANAYIDPLRVNPQTKVVAIMIRIEWFLIAYKRNSLKMVKDCLSKVLGKYNQYSRAHGVTRAVLALDIGRYGSGTFPTTLRRNHISDEYFSEVVEEIHQFVRQVNLDYNDWEESFETVTGGNVDRGYTAVLQSVIASKTDCVIRMGGGHYQLLALELFLKNHPNKVQQCIKEVCVPKRFIQHFPAM